jgi:nicotinate-nucleotide pyrophosphorylase (carboxylating)
MTTMLQPLTDALAPETLDSIIQAALDEDLGDGDVTTDATIPADMTCRGKVVCQSDGVIAGMAVVRRVFELVDPEVQCDSKVKDGEKVQEDQIVARLSGRARSILRAERVALNFLQHLSGVATLTAKYVKALEGTAGQIVDTRKTTPNLRGLEKYAARMGGASTSRMGLYDTIMIRDSHHALVGGISPALRSVRKAYPNADLVIEVSNLQELEQALADKAPRIMLDNFAPGQVREAMQMIRGRAIVEVGGGIKPDTARAYALAGAQFINVGGLTHGACALDFTVKLTRY